MYKIILNVILIMNIIMNKKFNFVAPKDDLEYNPQKHQTSYYQFCQFKNPSTNMYQTRKIIFDEMGIINKTYEKEYTKKQIEQFAKTHRDNKYKMYPVANIKYVALPNGHDMNDAQSELLNNTYTEYGNLNVKY